MAQKTVRKSRVSGRGAVRRRARASTRPYFEVGRWMTPAPYTIAPDRTLADAHALMRAHRIKHLPVVQDGKLVGIVTQRDLLLIESLPDVSADVPVDDALVRDVFVVEPADPVGRVCAKMAERRVGSAVVMRAGQIVGLFTVTDACRVLARVLG